VGVFMPTWMLTCPNRKNAFHHAEINTRTLANFLDPQKPRFPEGGLEVSARTVGTEMRTELMNCFIPLFPHRICPRLNQDSPRGAKVIATSQIR
jgi:hypothetical protein